MLGGRPLTGFRTGHAPYWLRSSPTVPAPLIPPVKLSPQQALFRALVATLFFSSVPACVRAVGLNAYTLGIVRLGIASLGMTAVLWYQGKLRRTQVQRWTARDWQAMVLVGLAFGLHWLFFFLSIKLASAAVGAIGFSTYGLHLLVLGWLLGLGRVTTIDLVGVSLAVIGTLLLVPEFSLQNQNTLGLVFGVAGGLSAAVLPLLHQRYADVDNNLRTWGQFTFALPAFLVFFPQTQWHIPLEDVALVLYLGFGVTLIAHSLWIQATTALSTTTTSFVSYLYLPVSLVIGYFAIGEHLTGWMLLGAACVLVANALVLTRQAKLKALEAQIPEST